jgi:ABC-type proline/glycine betaine transport system permease subunit
MGFLKFSASLSSFFTALLQPLGFKPFLDQILDPVRDFLETCEWVYLCVILPVSVVTLATVAFLAKRDRRLSSGSPQGEGAPETQTDTSS